jgi:hypothetical protein
MSTDFTKRRTILSAATVTGAGSWHSASTYKTLQAVAQTTSGAGACVVDIEVSNDGTNAVVLGTISLTLSSSATSDGFASASAWFMIRANVKSISGTNASVSVEMGADI